MKAFEIGKEYSMKSACDHNCVWTFKVISRTEKTVKITDGKETKTCKIIAKVSEWAGAESVYPFGRYSMAPVLRAENARG